jgi:hypothetical protein
MAAEKPFSDNMILYVEVVAWGNDYPPMAGDSHQKEGGSCDGIFPYSVRRLFG